MDENKMKDLIAISAKTGRAVGYMERDNRALRKSNFHKNVVICILGYAIYGLVKGQQRLHKEIESLKGEKEM